MSPDIHTLAGAYALDAVESDERTAFEAHLAECETCREDVLGLRAAAAALAPEFTPPAELRTKVLAAAERTPQLPPLVAPRATRSKTRRWTQLVAAAAAVVAIGGGGVALLQDDEPLPTTVTATQVFGARDAHTLSVPLGDGEVRVAVSKRLGRIAVDGADMPAPPEGHAYQLWLVDGSRSTSLSVMEGKETSAVKAIPTSGVLAVTVEPSGGSKEPTTDPILTLDPAEL